MPDLLALFDQYAILESFSHQVAFGDLLALSRTSARLRAVLHGIQDPTVSADYIKGSKVRASIYLGVANTALWSMLKRNSWKTCSELSHKKGGIPSGCQMCSMPVCAACVVRSSFKKNEKTFTQRRRHFCDQCWVSNVPHRERLHYKADRPSQPLYAKMDSCQCTAMDGILCTKCRQELHHDGFDDCVTCAGIGCGRILANDAIGGRICIWCNLTLPGTRSMEQSWTDFEQRRCMSWNPEAEAARAAEEKRRAGEEERKFKRSTMSDYDYQRFDMRFAKRRGSVSSTKSTKAPSESDRSEHTLVGDPSYDSDDGGKSAADE